LNIYKYDIDCQWRWVYNYSNTIMCCTKTDSLITGICLYSDEDIVILSILENGIRHNINGPAQIYRNGKLSYFINGIEVGINLSNKEFKQKIKEMVFK